MIGTSSHNCLGLCSSVCRLWNLLSASESLPYNESHGLEPAFTCPGLGSVVDFNLGVDQIMFSNFPVWLQEFFLACTVPWLSIKL
jgi:hypothetical protein